jgi:predicted TIM-barrel enzyme
MSGLMPYGDANAIAVDMAREYDMLTCPYVFTEEEAVEMTRAGADIIVAHMGTTSKGSIGAATTLSLEESAERIQKIIDAAKGINADVFVICHGGPVAEPEDAQYIYERTEGLSGFFGASSIERLATEGAIETQARGFKELSI